MGLAPMLVSQIFSIIKEINEQGTTVLLVEQNAVQALSLAHRAYVLELGRVSREAPARELLSDPAVREAYLGADDLPRARPVAGAAVVVRRNRALRAAAATGLPPRAAGVGDAAISECRVPQGGLGLGGADIADRDADDGGGLESARRRGGRGARAERSGRCR